jgi:predicted nucleotide-binding protein
VPLPDAESKLVELIEVGRRLEAEVSKATNAEEFTRRVDEWRRYSSEWLDQNLGGQAAGEYKRAITYAKTHAWSSNYWGQYYAARKKDITSEIRVLVSIGQRLPEWVESGARTPASDSANPKQGAVRNRSVLMQEPSQDPTFAKNRNAVMVIYGHDQEANDALFQWLRAIGLQPKEWSQLIELSGSGSPYIGQVLERAFQNVQAVVALFTPDEQVRAMDSKTWRLQARPNVLIEAGMALITHPDRTIFITLGPQELPSDLAGRHYIRLDGSVRSLNDLANRLQSAGCDIDRSGGHWLDPAIFPNRDTVPTRPVTI